MAQLPLAPVILGALIWTTVATLAAVFLFWLDKRRARQGGWRIPERILLGVAFLGGWFGAKYAQRLFRHKTLKQPFKTILNSIPIVWIVAGLLILMLRP